MVIAFDRMRLSLLAHQWGVRRLSVFGSHAKGTASTDSDIDLLVEFHENRKPSLIGHLRLEDGLSEIFRRRADLSTFESIRDSHNRRRKASILNETIEVFRDA
jgi:predicted nucleotidyltransferase